MRQFISLIAIFATVIFCSSCSDRMYVEAPCQLEDLNINGSLAKELGIINPDETVVDQNVAALNLSLNYGTGESYRVQIYTADPTVDAEKSYLLAYYILNDDSTTELLCNLPESINDLYVGITDSKGNKTVKSVAMLNGKADVNFGTLMASAK